MIEAEELLDECKEILVQRGHQYGSAEVLYKRTAALLSSYLRMDISDHNVCTIMALVKIGRLTGDSGDPATIRDTYVDAINYLALAHSLEK